MPKQVLLRMLSEERIRVVFAENSGATLTVKHFDGAILVSADKRDAGAKVVDQLADEEAVLVTEEVLHHEKERAAE